MLKLIFYEFNVFSKYLSCPTLSHSRSHIFCTVDISKITFKKNFRLERLKFLGMLSIKLIFHCDAKLFALGTFASPNAKIPTCWYLLR